MTLDPNPHFSGPLWARLVRRLLWLTPLYRAWKLDHSPSMSWLRKCRCRDCASIKYEHQPPDWTKADLSCIDRTY